MRSFALGFLVALAVVAVASGQKSDERKGPPPERERSEGRKAPPASREGSDDGDKKKPATAPKGAAPKFLLVQIGGQQGGPPPGNATARNKGQRSWGYRCCYKWVWNRYQWSCGWNNYYCGSGYWPWWNYYGRRR